MFLRMQAFDVHIDTICVALNSYLINASDSTCSNLCENVEIMFVKIIC